MYGNGSKRIALLLLLALLVSSFSFSQEKKYYITESQLIELERTQKEQKKTLEEQEKKINEQENQLNESDKTISEQERIINELNQSLRKSEMSNSWKVIKVGAVTFSIGVTVGAAAVILYNATR